MAAAEVLANPNYNRKIMSFPKSTETRWLVSEGWQKSERVFYNAGATANITIHFQYNTRTGCVDDLKVKNNKIV